MSGELFKKMAGIDMVHVPYKGGGPAVQDLVAGQVPLGVLGSRRVIPHHKSGRIRIIAFTSKGDFAPMPEIPTLHESGLAGFDHAVARLSSRRRGRPLKLFHRGAKANREGARAAGGEGAPCASRAAAGRQHAEEFDALIRADLERWTAIAKEPGSSSRR